MNISTPASLGAAVREARLGSGLTQQQLATEAGVSRKLIIELESGHERAQLGKALQVLGALGLGISAASSELQRELQEMVDKRMTGIVREISDGDYDFALRLAIDMFTMARELLGDMSIPFLRRPQATGDHRMDTLMLAALRWALGSELDGLRPWPAPRPLKDQWCAYDFQIQTTAYRNLIISDTPPELAQANVFIRARSMISV